MGMYTSLVFGATLDSERLDPKARAVLGYLAGQVCVPPVVLPAHPFFATRRWESVLSNTSVMFAGCSLHFVERRLASSSWYELHIRSALKNYDQEIELFLDWIAPYLDDDSGADGRFLGTLEYEEDPVPTLLWLHDGGIVFQSPNLPSFRQRPFTERALLQTLLDVFEPTVPDGKE